ncbi:hypothetical protein H696_04024 [Fonticula alba]|uniref:UFSP1/2/DUB catalytic domain-containing protein n=1 Tax=Fonticula alba TaxID=691883 RepID=A0A058Z5S0_FONAL|nr:hypothetical protein H696_04024 [Fonticula alba]KCV69605.1 hypothetical protein H696_04024 [Fonticula alba]|eukprot:XP_009496170.1 hypothetical protein H696_04024 [Fonticula alba]
MSSRAPSLSPGRSPLPTSLAFPQRPSTTSPMHIPPSPGRPARLGGTGPLQDLIRDIHLAPGAGPPPPADNTTLLVKGPYLFFHYDHPESLALGPAGPTPAPSAPDRSLRDILAGLERLSTEAGTAAGTATTGGMAPLTADAGWGCAYRSLQTLASHYAFAARARLRVAASRGESPQSPATATLPLPDDRLPGEPLLVPSVAALQEVIRRHLGTPSLGSAEWIGTAEVAQLMDLLYEVPCRVVHMAPGAGLPLETLVNHFMTVATPVMLGGNSKAFTILGISLAGDDALDLPAHVPLSCPGVRLLMLDPHIVWQKAWSGEAAHAEYIGALLRQGACQWKPLHAIFQTDTFYNFCLPIKRGD